MPAWAAVQHSASGDRGDTTIPGDARTLALTAGELSLSWGAGPATAQLTYSAHLTGDQDIRSTLPGVPVGAYCNVTLGPYIFYGRCRACTAHMASSGHQWVMDFEDLRGDLQIDNVFGVFNQRDDRVVPGVDDLPMRVRQWWHMLPNDVGASLRTYTNTPKTGRQIIEALLGANTVASPWTCLWHSALDVPLTTTFDWETGTRLDQALLAVCERAGVQFTLSGPFQLKFRRKGELLLGESFPVDGNGFYIFPRDAKRTDADNLRDGFGLSGHPDRITVVGERNRYQIHNLQLVPDWARGWDAWWDESVFRLWVFSTQTATIVGDDEDIIRWQRAEVLALSLTVRQVVALLGPTYADYRRHGGRCRMDMPAILYIRDLVFRAWRLPDTMLGISARSWALADSMLCAVTHDAAGIMSADTTRPQDGNGYVIAQGYGSNPEFFQNLDPRRFNLDEWVSAQAAWSVVDFELGGDAGDGIPYLVASVPLFVPTGLVVQPDGANGLMALNGAFVPVPTAVRACLTLLGDRFKLTEGLGYRDGLLTEPGLHNEWIYDATAPGVALAQIPYIDGQTPAQKAVAMANVLLLRQPVIHSGGYARALNDGDGAMVLNGMYDRLSLKLEGNGVITETVDFTTERTFDAFQPERLFDRRVRVADLFPGQENLRSELQLARLNLNVLTRNPALRAALANEYRGQLGSSVVPASVTITGGIGTLKAGTPLWQSPGGSRPVMPSATGSSHTIMSGVSTREGEPAAGLVPVLRSGRVLVRAKGPVAPGDRLGRSAGHDYLEKDGGDAAMVARAAIAGSDVRLIEADFGGGTSTSDPYYDG